jgi:cyclase
MRKIMLSLTPAAAILAAAAFMASAQAPPQGKEGGKGGGGGKAAAPQTIREIKPGLYQVTGAGGNATVRVTPDGLIIGDTKNRGDNFFNEMMTLVRTVSQAPVRYVFITHHHQDHSGNIGNFIAAGAQVIAHDNLKKNLVTYAPAQGKPADPNVTYTNNMHSVKLGNVEVRGYHFARAHTSGDTIIYYPDLRVIQGGDVIVGGAPNVDFPFGGSAVEWVKMLDEVAKLDFDTVVPGHSSDAAAGNTMSRADFMAYKDKWEKLVSRSKELVKAGTPKEELLAKIKTDDIGWNVNGGQWTQPARLDPFYAELQAAK